MAERRMFAKTIVLSDAFLDMPLSTRCLYFTLGMFADDDGFVNGPKAIIRQCGASEDDIKVLIAKRFILPFESGVIVIKHWRINNYLQKDRYNGTKYVEEKETLLIEENGAYTRTDEESSMYTQDVDTQVRLGKVSIGKDIPPLPPMGADTQFDAFWKAYPKKVGKGAAEKSFKKYKPDDAMLEQMLTAIESQKKTDQWKRDGGQFIPNPATWLNQKRWEDETLPSKPVNQNKSAQTGDNSSIDMNKISRMLHGGEL